jgi:hypothetical protein
MITFLGNIQMLLSILFPVAAVVATIGWPVAICLLIATIGVGGDKRMLAPLAWILAAVCPASLVLGACFVWDTHWKYAAEAGIQYRFDKERTEMCVSVPVAHGTACQWHAVTTRALGG